MPYHAIRALLLSCVAFASGEAMFIYWRMFSLCVNPHLESLLNF